MNHSRPQAVEAPSLSPLGAELLAVLNIGLAPLIEAMEARRVEPEYRSRADEAARLGVSLTTLDRLCRDGLPFVRVGDARRFRAAQVDAWIDAQGGSETTGA